MTSVRKKDEGKPHAQSNEEKDIQRMKDCLDDLVEILTQERRIEESLGAGVVDLSQVKSWSQKKMKSKDSYSSQSKLLGNAMRPSFSLDSRLNQKISLWKGNILDLKVDAIVFGTSRKLYHRFGQVAKGNAVIKDGSNLLAKYVIQTAYPTSGGGLDPDALRSCYENSFQLMLQHDLRTIAFERFGVADGFTNAPAAEIAIRTTRSFLEKHGDQLDRIVFVLPHSLDLRIYGDVCQDFFPLEVDRKAKDK